YYIAVSMSRTSTTVLYLFFFFSMIPPPPTPPLFPYTTLFRSRAGRVDAGLLTLPIEESDLVTVPVMREELLVVMPPGHTLAKRRDRKSTRLNSSHLGISYAVFCLKKKKKNTHTVRPRAAARHL